MEYLIELRNILWEIVCNIEVGVLERVELSATEGNLLNVTKSKYDVDYMFSEDIEEENCFIKLGLLGLRCIVCKSTGGKYYIKKLQYLFDTYFFISSDAYKLFQCEQVVGRIVSNKGNHSSLVLTHRNVEVIGLDTDFSHLQCVRLILTEEMGEEEILTMLDNLGTGDRTIVSYIDELFATTGEELMGLLLNGVVSNLDITYEIVIDKEAGRKWRTFVRFIGYMCNYMRVEVTLDDCFKKYRVTENSLGEFIRLFLTNFGINPFYDYKFIKDTLDWVTFYDEARVEQYMNEIMV